jgi:hypothetical protein
MAIKFVRPRQMATEMDLVATIGWEPKWVNHRHKLVTKTILVTIRFNFHHHMEIENGKI